MENILLLLLIGLGIIRLSQKIIHSIDSPFPLFSLKLSNHVEESYNFKYKGIIVIETASTFDEAKIDFCNFALKQKYIDVVKENNLFRFTQRGGRVIEIEAASETKVKIALFNKLYDLGYVKLESSAINCF